MISLCVFEMGSFTFLMTSTPMAPLPFPWEGFLIGVEEGNLSMMSVMTTEIPKTV